MLKPDNVVSHEIDISLLIAQGFNNGNGCHLSNEIKYTDIFSMKSSDEDKLLYLSKCINYIKGIECEILVSHCSCSDGAMEIVNMPGKKIDGQKQIQSLAWHNYSRHIKEITKDSLVQAIVDLGLSESFRPIYNMYQSIIRGVVDAKFFEIDDENITIPNFRNILPPVFIDSRDSRLIQISDVIIGSYNACNKEKRSDFSKRVHDVIMVIEEKVIVNSVVYKNIR